MTGYTPVHVEELTDLADVFAAVEDWLLRACDETIADYHDFYRDRHFEQLVDDLGTRCVRLRRLANQADAS